MRKKLEFLSCLFWLVGWLNDFAIYVAFWSTTLPCFFIFLSYRIYIHWQLNENVECKLNVLVFNLKYISSVHTMNYKNVYLYWSKLSTQLYYFICLFILWKNSPIEYFNGNNCTLVNFREIFMKNPKNDWLLRLFK